MDYNAVLFDMDGVIINTEAAVTAFWEGVARDYHVQLTPEMFDTQIFGCPCRQTLDVLFPHLSPSERAAVLDEEEIFETHMRYHAMAGVIPLLKSLREHSIATALVTSGERWKVEEVMQQLGIGNLFTTRVTVEDTPSGKPHPACYRLAAEQLGIETACCIVFEDSLSGVRAAIAAGTTCVGVRPERTAAALIELGACCTIKDFEAVKLIVNETPALVLPSQQRFTLHNLKNLH